MDARNGYVSEGDEFPAIPEFIDDVMRSNKHFGQMNDPSGSAYIKGACGDQMEFYIVVEGGTITDVRFYTDGCGYTMACGATASHLAAGKPISEALSISAGQVLAELETIPESHTHCAILAVSALYKAIADYLLKP